MYTCLSYTCSFRATAATPRATPWGVRQPLSTGSTAAEDWGKLSSCSTMPAVICILCCFGGQATGIQGVTWKPTVVHRCRKQLLQVSVVHLIFPKFLSSSGPWSHIQNDHLNQKLYLDCWVQHFILSMCYASAWHLLSLWNMLSCWHTTCTSLRLYNITTRELAGKPRIIKNVMQLVLLRSTHQFCNFHFMILFYLRFASKELGPTILTK